MVGTVIRYKSGSVESYDEHNQLIPDLSGHWGLPLKKYLVMFINTETKLFMGEEKKYLYRISVQHFLKDDPWEM